MSPPPSDDHLRLSAIVSSSDDAIIGKDLNGTITSWNTAAERIFGYSATEAIGQSIRLIIPPDRTKRKTTFSEKCGPAKGFVTTKRFVWRRTDAVVDISLTVSPIRASDGTVIGASTDCAGRDADEAIGA